MNQNQNDLNTLYPWSSNQRYMGDKEIKRVETPIGLYLLNLNTGVETIIKLIPESLAEKYAPKIAKKTPYGVVRPLNFYTGGSSKELAFSFDLHEDLNSLDGSIYALVDLIQSMSLPVTKNNVVQSPLVYLQLGEQFAGKGYLTTTFDFKGPFRNGRYLMSTCTLNFVFKEEYANNNISLEDTTTSNGIATLAHIYFSESDIDSILADYDPTNNLTGTLDISNDYFISQVYKDEKLLKYYNLLTKNSSSTSGMDLSTEGVIKLLGQKYMVGYSLETNYNWSGQDFETQLHLGKDVLILMSQFIEVASNKYSFATRLANFDNLLAQAEAISLKIRKEEQGQANYYYLKPEQLQTLKEALERLKVLINIQIDLIRTTSGVGN